MKSQNQTSATARPSKSELEYNVITADIRSAADILDAQGKHDLADKICAEHAALVAVAEAMKAIQDLSCDLAGSKLTLREVFGTFHQMKQVEGEMSLAALAALAAVRGKTGGDK